MVDLLNENEESLAKLAVYVTSSPFQPKPTTQQDVTRITLSRRHRIIMSVYFTDANNTRGIADDLQISRISDYTRTTTLHPDTVRLYLAITAGCEGALMVYSILTVTIVEAIRERN
jgi:hypothetical protein